MKVTIFDYGAGNLHSLTKGLVLAGATVTVEPDPVLAAATDVLVLPGVGAFGPAAARLAPGLAPIRKALASGLPCLGICLGMQLLCNSSDEGDGEGIGRIGGQVTRLRAEMIPQIGWNALEERDDPTLRASGLRIAYFANGFACRPVDPDVTRAWTTHESDRFPAVIRRGRTLGVQFHPEKSSRQGVAFLKAFLEECRQ